MQIRLWTGADPRYGRAMSVPDVAEAGTGELVLDPFAFQPGKASVIEGLGGDLPHEDLSYAFHTDYVPAADGPCHFIVRFQGLAAKLGTLQLRVHMFVEDEKPRLMLGNSVRIQLNRLIQLGGEVPIRFDGFERVRYALYGNILGGTDARADALTVALDRPATARTADATTVELRNSAFGRDATRAVPMMVSGAAPTLARPVSQAATHAQTREPAFAEWCARMGRPAAPDRAGWAAAYVLQALRAYGMLRPDARGLGLGAGADALAGAMRAMAIDAVAAEAPPAPEQLPGGLVNFDFLWSIDEAVRFGADGTAAYLEALMRCLRPGGVAVHVLPFAPDAGGMDRGDGDGVVRRATIERIALTMISRNIETAQVKIAWDDPILEAGPPGRRPVGAFGMVLRKAPVAGA